MGKKKKKKNRRNNQAFLYENPVQFYSPVRLVVDFSRQKPFSEMKKGDVFHYFGKIYKKSNEMNAYLIYSDNINDIGYTYTFEPTSICQLAMPQFRKLAQPKIVGIVKVQTGEVGNTKRTKQFSGVEEEIAKRAEQQFMEFYNQKIAEHSSASTSKEGVDK